MKAYFAQTYYGLTFHVDANKLIKKVLDLIDERPIGFLIPEEIFKEMDKNGIEPTNFNEVLRKQMTIDEIRQKDVLIIPFNDDNSPRIIDENWERFMGNKNLVKIFT